MHTPKRCSFPKYRHIASAPNARPCGSRPEALDEYELQRLAEARNDGLRAALMASIGLLIVTGLIAVSARLTGFMDGVFVAHIYFKLICAQLAFVPFTVTRSLAGKINRDELISSE